MSVTKTANILWVALAWIIELWPGRPLPAAQMPDPARTLRNQDAAFSLLVEAFREVQGSLIQTDNELRQRAGEQLRDPQTRHAVAWMSDLERHLRQQKLAAQVERLQVTYEYARRNDERAAGVSVPSAVNLQEAAAKLREFVVLAPEGLQAPIFADSPATQCATHSSPTVPRRFLPHVALLRQSTSDEPALFEAVTNLLASPGAQQQGRPTGAPALIVVSWRKQAGTVARVVVQVFEGLPPMADTEEAVRACRTGFVRGEMFTPIENWLRLVGGAPVLWLGAPDDVRPRQRAFSQLQQGDPTLLREQTVEPLQVAAAMTEPSTFLPTCLRSRVRALGFAGELSWQQWHGEVRLVTQRHEDAQQVAAVMSSWRAMVSPLADFYAPGDSRQKLRDAVDTSAIVQSGEVALVRGNGPSALCARAAVKLMRLATEAAP